jgi:hypothetical protein
MKFIPNTVTQKFARQILVLQHNSPRLLFGVGVAGVITSTVLACKSTLKLSATFEEIEHEVASVKQDLSKSEHYKSDLTYVYVKGVVSIGRLYAPSLLLARHHLLRLPAHT